MQQRIQRLFETVLEDEEARELVAANPLSQDVVFRVDGNEDVIVSLEPNATDVTVATGTAEYDLFTTTVLELDERTLDSLLKGAYLSEHYLEGDLEISGLPSIKILLGQLFRINHDRQ
jgi:hypothetical protein